MDTKLKNYNLNSPAGAGYVLAWILCTAATVLSAAGASIMAAMLQIKEQNYNDYGYYDEYGNYVPDESIFTGEITGVKEINDVISTAGIAAIVLALVAIVMLMIIIVWTGRFNREEEGQIHLNWFDRIWSELHLCVVVAFACFVVLLTGSLMYLWTSENWFGVFQPKYGSEAYYGAPNDMMLVLIIIGMTVSVISTYASVAALVKKIKAKQFWEKSLVGGIFLAAYRAVKGSDNTMLKVLAVLTVSCFLCATWFGLPVVLVLLFVFVPRQIKKYRQICRGVEEVKNGNLSYQIPTEADTKGVMGEFDRLAADINKISEAQNIAVQNELKNQRMKTDLISNVSHDLKTPLTSMVTYIDLLKTEGLDSPDAAEYLNIIDSKTQRLKNLTENLFEAAKASSGAIPVEFTKIDILALVSQSLAEMDEKLAGRGLTVIVKNQCEDGCKVMADGQLLWRVIENLLGNISKYALEGSRVYLNIERILSKNPARKNKILLEFKNISADPLNISADELMERFKRGDESRNTEGSGLGLAIAKDLIHLMKGIFQITVDGDLFKACLLLDEADKDFDEAGSGETRSAG